MLSSHGIFQVSATDNDHILKVNAVGPFNPQAVDHYEQQILEFIPTFTGPWAQLNIINQNCLYTPDAEKKLHALTVLKSQNNLRFVAVVFKECLCEMVLEEKIKNFYQSQGVECQFFSSEDESIQWLEEQLTSSSTISTCA